MDQFLLFAKRITERPLIVVQQDGKTSIGVSIFFSDTQTGYTGFLRHFWDPNNIIGSRPAAARAYNTKEAATLLEPFTNLPVSITEVLASDIIHITRAAEQDSWQVGASNNEMALAHTYIALSLGSLFSSAGNDSATRIWSTMVINQTWPLLQQ